VPELRRAPPPADLPARKRPPPAWRRLSIAAAALILLAGLSLSLILSFRPPIGESVPTSPPGQSIPAGSDPGSYSTDPPTSGVHFPVGLRPGFYTLESAATLPRYPAGFLVTNLEQGDVVVWYNCDRVPPGECDELRGQIRLAMDLLEGEHILVFPWQSIEQPVVLTSWGHILRLEAFDFKSVIGFIFAHRGRGPG
jgi:hypothetical protein